MHLTRSWPVFFAVICMFYSACRGKAAEEKDKTGFCLTDTLQQKVIIDPVKYQVVKDEISLSGKIEANEDKWVKVFPVVGGMVEEMKVQLGDYVTKGQTLAVIRSGELADYQSQLSNAQASVKIAEKNLDVHQGIV